MEGPEARFEEVEGADALVLRDTGSGIKEDIVLTERPASDEAAGPLEFTYDLRSARA